MAHEMLKRQARNHQSTSMASAQSALELCSDKFDGWTTRGLGDLIYTTSR